MSPDDFAEKIELLVSDENKIVTYKILSHEMGIHVNKAKQYMMEYLNVQRAKGISLEVYYFLAGFIEKDGMRSVKVLVVSEDNVETAKKSFTELTSFHIYSIYKGESKDECTLYSADFSYIKDKREQNKYSAIKHPGIEIQPPVLNKMPVTKDTRPTFYKKDLPANGSTISPVDPKTDMKGKVAEDKISPKKGNTSKDIEAQDSKANKSDAHKPKSGTLMSMWQKKEEKPNTTKKENTKVESKGKEAVKSVPKGNILSMFSKQAEKNATKPPPPPKSLSKETENSNDFAPETIKKDTLKKVQATENKKLSQKRKGSDKHSKLSKKPKNDSDSDSEFQSKPKKHRRICTFDDSSSESEPEEEKDKTQRSFFLPEEPMETIEATPISDEEPIPPTPPVVKGKAKIWKTIQKTYEDEDGFFVTKNEKELVSASEDEEEPVKEKPVKKEVVDKKNNVNKKQASLMSFFKQK